MMPSAQWAASLAAVLTVLLVCVRSAAAVRKRQWKVGLSDSLSIYALLLSCHSTSWGLEDTLLCPSRSHK